MELPRFHRLRGPYYRLEGSRCRDCDARQFPPRSVCPACGRRNLEPQRFSGRATLYASTRVTQAPRGHASLAPYSVALVRLEEGPLVAAQLTDVGDESLPAGLPLEMVTRKLRDAEEHGLVVYGYKFRPRLEGDRRP
jgi:uncharacterized OB-fold protein